MEIKISDVGVISEAAIRVSNLAVITGLNSTGKSTIGKCAFLYTKADNIARDRASRLSGYSYERGRRVTANRHFELLFENDVTPNGCVEVTDSTGKVNRLVIVDNICSEFSGYTRTDWRECTDATIITTPSVFDLFPFFSSISAIVEAERQLGEEAREISVSYPYVLWDLYKKITVQKLTSSAVHFPGIVEAIDSRLGGRFERDNSGELYFIENGNRIRLSNTSLGHRVFGTIQLLLRNKQINRSHLLILDEPENHLHPYWQIDYARLIVTLAKQVGCKIIVSTHNPYMFQALHQIAREQSAEASFYILRKANGRSNCFECSGELTEIYEYFAAPMFKLSMMGA